MAAAAVNIAPQRLRGIFAGVALLAQPLQLAGSLSADAAVLGYLFCFTALCLTLRTRPARWPETVAAVVLAALIAFSRIYLYVHYPSDVLAGAVLGMGLGYMGYKMVDTWGFSF